MLAVQDKPILMSAPMVRAVWNGDKTKTRRIIKPQPIMIIKGIPFTNNPKDFMPTLARTIEIKCPYGAPGGLLWVRENYSQPYIEEKNAETFYRADGDKDLKWKPSIFMPRWASRLTLKITDVSVQRLQDISEEDAIAEGIEYDEGGDLADGRHSGGGFFDYINGEKWDLSATDSFKTLWLSINGPDSWAANPYVWALTFDVFKCNIDDYLKKVAA